MQEEIEKLGQIIDSLRAKASNPEYQAELLDWLADPSYDSAGIIELLALRQIIRILQEQRDMLFQLLEDEVYDIE